MKKAFIRVARQRELSLKQVWELADKARTVRPTAAQSRHQSAIDDLGIWEAALEELASEQQRGLLDTELSSHHSVPVQVQRAVGRPGVRPIPCPRPGCPAMPRTNVAKCPECGYGLDPNWN